MDLVLSLQFEAFVRSLFPMAKRHSSGGSSILKPVAFMQALPMIPSSALRRDFAISSHCLSRLEVSYWIAVGLGILCFVALRVLEWVIFEDGGEL